MKGKINNIHEIRDHYDTTKKPLDFSKGSNQGLPVFLVNHDQVHQS